MHENCIIYSLFLLLEEMYTLCWFPTIFQWQCLLSCTSRPFKMGVFSKRTELSSGANFSLLQQIPNDKRGKIVLDIVHPLQMYPCPLKPTRYIAFDSVPLQMMHYNTSHLKCLLPDSLFIWALRGGLRDRTNLHNSAVWSESSVETEC